LFCSVLCDHPFLLLLLLLLQALNLIKAGYKVVVWNRSADKCEPLKAAGATVRSSSSGSSSS
jgi:hypothetical protein